MDEFWRLLEESVILQALITVVLIGTICYLYITGREVPQPLVDMALLILGYYFGSKTQQFISRGRS